MRADKKTKITKMNQETKIFTCPKCKRIGTDASVIAAGYCHKRSGGHRSGDKTTDKKLEQKYRVKGMSKISVKKFNSYDS